MFYWFRVDCNICQDTHAYKYTIYIELESSTSWISIISIFHPSARLFPSFLVYTAGWLEPVLWSTFSHFITLNSIHFILALMTLPFTFMFVNRGEFIACIKAERENFFWHMFIKRSRLKISIRAQRMIFFVAMIRWNHFINMAFIENQITRFLHKNDFFTKKYVFEVSFDHCEPLPLL